MSYDDASVALIIKIPERTALLVWLDFLFNIYCFFFFFFLILFHFNYFYFVEFDLSIKSCEIPL